MRALPLLFLLAACSCGSRQPSRPRDPERQRDLVRSELLHACVAPSGVYRYQAPGEEPECDDPKPVLWPRVSFPLSVEVVAPESGCEHTNIGGPAVAAVNSMLGFKALRVVRGLPRSFLWQPPDIVVKVCADLEDALLGYAFHIQVGGSPAGLVVLGRDQSDERSAILVLAHELGHALGLAHDPGERGSLMYPGAGWSFAASRFSDEDVEVLRSLYAPLSN